MWVNVWLCVRLPFRSTYRSPALLTGVALAVKLDSVAVNFEISLSGKLELIEFVVIHVLDCPTGDTNQMVVRFKIGVIAGVRLIERHNETSSLKGVECVVDGVW